MSATIEEIARVTGFSVSTVSRVLNKKSRKNRISAETEKIISEAAKELNYRPNEVARGLRLKRTHTIGLVVPDISNPFFAYVTHVIQMNAFDAGYSLIVCNTNEDIEMEVAQIELLRRKGVDGYIIMPVGTQHDHIKDLIEHKKPVVLLDRNIDELDVSSIIVDNYKGVYEAVDYMIKCGHERIAIIQGLQNTYTNNERVRGYKDALADNNLLVDENLILGDDFRSENGYYSTKSLLKLDNPPTAIFAFSDLITLGTLQAFNEENIKLPEDISLIAFDDIDFGPYLISPLTAVRQPRESMGEEAVKLLIDKMINKKDQGSQKILLDPKLIIRESVKVFSQESTVEKKIYG